ncbi:methyltransferase domain-containing protein [Mesoterricola sediminis]|uniref:methyltransferase domain-containing protein n=1 Tax=Mesoterricola sediminis TaxID=2927980 RepID=UPI001FAFDE53|nr:methyltransferase domain-containing protein [Mesoterricola sediminis]
MDRYAREDRPGWDMDGPTPVLPELLDRVAAAGLALGPTVAVPGCGFGHDAAALAAGGFQVTGLDFAAPALARAQARYGDAVAWRQEDWFGGGAAFDAIFDHTCFSAMAPERRAAYMAACARRLRPGGLWLVVFFTQVRDPQGPPFAQDPAGFRTLVEGVFDVAFLGPAERSHPRRAGREAIAVLRLKDQPAPV